MLPEGVFARNRVLPGTSKRRRQHKNSIFWLGMAISMDAKAPMMYLHRAEAFIALRAASKCRQIKRAIWKDIACSTAIPVLLKHEEITKNFWSLILTPNTLLMLGRSCKVFQ
jgi:hypothetical protein